MCGICGGVNISHETVLRMLQHQHSRGPDNTGIAQRGNVIFGHNRLSIIDKSEQSSQPVNIFYRNLLTYNGEIYNYNPNYASDTLWLYSALDENLESVVNSLNGMFAFGYYDGDKIYLVRDRFGIKPLYYYHNGDVFAFASTPGALSLIKNSKWSISEKGFAEYITLGATQLHSMFDGIKAVPPGHYVIYDLKSNTATVNRWYYPKKVENAIERIPELVEQAIDRVKLTCDWPQIVLLSGGIDSTLVASRYMGNSAIHLRSPEEEYAKKVAEKFNLNLITADPQESSAEEDLTDYIHKSGDPTMAGLIPYITCKEIARKGFRVAITANGADELFYGYNRMTGSREDQVMHIFRPLADLTLWDKLSPQELEIGSYLTYDLNKTLDFASMCHSVEVRVPYLDHELVEAAMSIPAEKHVARLGNKTLLKEMLVKLGFDYDFIHRPKVGFSLHYVPGDWEKLKNQAMKWYKSTKYPQLADDANGRHIAYHQNTVIGLYLWHRIYQ